jgi:hypothetical protein
MKFQTGTLPANIGLGYIHFLYDIATSNACLASLTKENILR